MKNVCLVCSNQIVLVKGPTRSNYASAFRDTTDNHKNNIFFGWGFCQNCFCLQNINQEKTYFTTRYYNWIDYNEPDWHFDNILSDLKGLQSSTGDFQCVIGLNYKDTTLVEAISKEFNIQSHPSDFIGTTSDWHNIGLDKSKKRLINHIMSISKGKKSILIVRRILDHCSYPIELLKTLNCLLPGSTIYIEMNDYKQLVKNNIFDFIWNERTFYPLSNHVENIINEASLHPIIVNSISNNSESIFYSFARVNQKKQNFRFNQSNTNSIDIKNLKNYVYHWRELKDYWYSVCLKEKLGIVGASHKGISFSQLFLNNVEYYLFDDSLKKQGKYHPDKNIAVASISSIVKNQVNRLIVTISEKWHNKLKSQIQSIDNKVKLYTFEGTQI